MKQYLINLHDSLNINKLINKNKRYSNKKNATEICDIIKKQMNYLCQQSYENFKKEFLIVFNLRITNKIIMNNCEVNITNMVKYNAAHLQNINANSKNNNKNYMQTQNFSATQTVKIRPPTFDMDDTKINKISDISLTNVDIRPPIIKQQIKQENNININESNNQYYGRRGSISDNICAQNRHNPMNNNSDCDLKVYGRQYQNISVLGVNLPNINIHTNTNTNINTNINTQNVNANDQNGYL
eukprot:343242_1